MVVMAGSSIYRHLKSRGELHYFRIPTSTESSMEEFSKFSSLYFQSLCWGADIAGVVELGDWMTEKLYIFARKFLLPEQRDSLDRGLLGSPDDSEFAQLITRFVDDSLSYYMTELDEIEWVVSDRLPALYIPSAGRYRSQEGAQRILDLHTMSYSDYLQTPEWKRRREVILEDAGYRCRACNHNSSLHVHHRTYERRGYERKSDLIALCPDCHQMFHEHRILAPIGGGES